jgi:excinuclease UvrABC nuclease subunit
MQKLLKHFGSSELVRAANEEQLAEVAGRAAARRAMRYYEGQLAKTSL